jgi:hypothetical protein
MYIPCLACSLLACLVHRLPWHAGKRLQSTLGHVCVPSLCQHKTRAKSSGATQQQATEGAWVPAEVWCHFDVILQVVFVGVFLLTRASQPAAAAEQSSDMKQVGSKRVAYVGDEPEQQHGLTTAPSEEHKWRLPAVRSAQSGGSNAC